MIESDIDLVEIFKTMYEEKNEDSFDQRMEVSDQIYTPLFSDKEFLNEDWHKYTCTESCAAIGNARHGCESLGTDIQSIKEIDDSGCTLLSENGNVLANMTGSSILKSTDHTSQVKPGNLSGSSSVMENLAVITFLTQSNLKESQTLMMIGNHV